MALRVRSLTTEERSQIERLARSRTAPIRLVERVRMIDQLLQGERVPAVARRLSVNERTVRSWLKRFNDQGLAGLEDRPRPGRKPTYSPEVVGEVLAIALPDPRTLGLPFACRTIRRLEAYLNEVKGIAIKRSRLDEILLAEGLRWRPQETGFGEQAQAANAESQTPPEAITARVDPDFAEKRGRSSGFTRPRLQAM